MKKLLLILLFLFIRLYLFPQAFTEQTGISLPGVYLGSVEWGDYDNDGHLDILLTGQSTHEAIAKIFRNNGNGTFTEQTGILLTGIYFGNAVWGDYDNDGFQDILLSGYSNTGGVSKLYRNNGDHTFTEQVDIQLTGTWGAICRFMDYDNDGDLDIFLSGEDAGYHRLAKIYRNNGNNTFTEQFEIPFQGVTQGSVEWADFNNDGKTDIFLTGVADGGNVSKIFMNDGNNAFSELTGYVFQMNISNSSTSRADFNNDGFIDLLVTGNNYGQRRTFIYQNNGGDSFSELNMSSVAGFDHGSVAWGDYDNDGYPDILISGSTDSGPLTKIYRNNGDGSFTEQTEIILTGLWHSSVAWGDYDNDGDLDIIITGCDAAYNPITKIYRNDLISPNNPPAVPTGLISGTDEGIVRFWWNKSSDDETGQDGLNYNLYLYESGHSSYIRPPHAFPYNHLQNGKRHIASAGNIQWPESGYPIMNLAPGKTYYWSVQAVDGGFMGSPFAFELSFFMPMYRPYTQGNGISFSGMEPNQISIDWANGGGVRRVVFIREGTEGSADPQDHTSYTINSLTSGGWKCVYNGSDNQAVISGLIPGKNYIIHVCEYNGDAGNELYLTATTSGNPAIINTVFTEVTGINLPGLFQSSVAWGDYDNDGHLDILLTGIRANYDYYSGIWRNNGDNTFTEQTHISLAKAGESSVAWGDYDNDGYLDILFSGYKSGSYVTIIYRNNGDNTFTEQTDISLTGIAQGSVAWVDFDNDGDLDVHLTGYSVAGYVSEIYRNEGNHTFTKQARISLPGVTNCSVAWGDYDNDGYMDVLLAGATGTYTNYAPVTKLFRNNGDNTFTEQKDIQLPGVFYCSVAWGDYNSDGYPDILLTGTTISNRITRIYRNNGNNSFTALEDIALPDVSGGSAIWGDYDNDGDLDILLCGDASGNTLSLIIRNDGDDIFTKQPGISLTGVDYCSVAFGDYDNDGDLDILLTGQDPDGNKVAKVYRNNIEKVNQLPAKPENLSFEILGKNVILTWDKVDAGETQSGSISYNLMAGTSSGAVNIVTPHASADGFRRIPAIGNAQLDTSYILKDLRWDTTYYARVQAIDNSFKGGSFSDETQFSISPVQSSGLHAEYINSSSILLRWERGNGDRCIVFAREGISDKVIVSLPQDYFTYYANPFYGDGSPIGSSEWYCVFKGTADSLLLMGLEPQNNYIIHVIEFQGANGFEIYAKPGDEEDNIGVFSTALFSEQTSVIMTSVSWGTGAWGDYDNDGYLDILLTGNASGGASSEIYRNNGNGSFTMQGGTGIQDLSYSPAAWCDYDGDGYLDFILTGSDPFGNYYTKIFRNNGDHTFTEQTGISLTGVSTGSVSWGDYNNDGYPDLLLTGMDRFQVPHSKVYMNNGDNTFTEQTNIVLTDIWAGKGEWIDFDNDGYLDIVLNGQPAGGAAVRTSLYRNNRDNTFDLQTDIPFEIYWARSMSWGDYNNDGKPDMLVTGWSYNGIYLNAGHGEFIEQPGVIALPSFSGRSTSIWGDYDNDGYLDIIIAGQTAKGHETMVFRNNGNNTFSQQTEISMTGIDQSTLSIGDYDNDGDMDILMTGINNSGVIITKLFRNNLLMRAGSFSPNNRPSAPVSLRNTDVPGGTRLSWDPVAGDETPAPAMSYNLRYRQKDEENWRSAPHSDDEGIRFIPALGNLQLNNSYTLIDLPSDKYYWQVQAVDQGYLGSEWSALDSFIVKNTQAFFQADTVCQGLPTHFTDQSVAGDGIASWHWDFSDGSSSDTENPEYTFANAGTYTVKLVITSTEGDKDSLIQEVSVKPKPLVDFTASLACQGSETTLTNLTDVQGLTISSWSWDYGDGKGSILQSPGSHGYLSAGDYQVGLYATANNGCQGQIQKTVSVGAYPVAAITANAPLTFCAGDSVTLSVAYNTDYSYQWRLGGTPVTGAESYSIKARQTGSYSVQVVNPLGNCTTLSGAVSVTARNAPVSPTIVAGGPVSFCQGDSVLLSVTHDSEMVYRWKLNGGDVGTSTNEYKARTEGTYNLVVMNSTGCSSVSTNTILVTVKSNPVLSTVSLSGPTTFCEGGELTMSVPFTLGYTYRWENEFGAITGAAGNSYQAFISGSYRLVIGSMEGCEVRTSPIQVTMKPNPVMTVIATENYESGQCLGDIPIVLRANPTIPGYTYQWKRNGIIIPGATQGRYEGVREGGEYTVLADNQGCRTESGVQSVVLGQGPPKPALIAEGPVVWYLACSNDSAAQYRWYYEGQVISGADKHIYVANQELGTYMVAISTGQGCFTFSDPMTIPPDAIGINVVDVFSTLKIFPNPTSGMFTIVMDNQVYGDVLVSVFTEEGRKVWNGRYDKITGYFSCGIDIGVNGSGVYFVNVRAGSKEVSRKLVVGF